MKKKINHEWEERYPSMDIALRHLYQQVACYEREGWSAYTIHAMDHGAKSAYGPSNRVWASAKFTKVVEIEGSCP